MMSYKIFVGAWIVEMAGFTGALYHTATTFDHTELTAISLTGILNAIVLNFMYHKTCSICPKMRQ